MGLGLYVVKFKAAGTKSYREYFRYNPSEYNKY